MDRYSLSLLILKLDDLHKQRVNGQGRWEVDHGRENGEPVIEVETR